MKKLTIIIFIFLNFLVILNSQNFELSNNFKNMIKIDNLNQELIELDLSNIDYKDYFRFFIIVSEDYDKINEYKKWFTNLETIIENELSKKFSSLNIQNLSLEEQKSFAENILFLLHTNIFSTYEEIASKISDIIERKQFNCVSSSIMYAIFLLKYKFNIIAIETKDHVFIEIKFKDGDIDVETTNKMGFDPGKKKDVLDNFGKITGFSYVPKKDYKNRKESSLKRLLLIVYNNLTNLYFKKGDSVKAANLSYIIYKATGDSQSYDWFLNYFNNHIVVLLNKKSYKTIFEDVNSFLSYFGLEEKIVNLRYEVISKFVIDYSNFKEYVNMENFLLEQKDLFIKDKSLNEKKFSEIYSYFVYITTNYFIKNKDFNKAFEIVKKANLYFNNPDFEKIFNNILVEIINNYTKNNNFEYLENILINLKANFPQYIKTIRLFEKINILAKINKLTIDKKFEEALKEIERNYNEYENDSDFNTIYLNFYVKYIQDFYDNNDINNVIKYSEIAITIFKNNNIILNNYRAYLINFVVKEFNSKNFSRAREYLNIAIQKFSDENILKDIDKKLKELKY